MLSTDHGNLKLSATNLELGVIKSVKCQVTNEGEVTVPSRTFLEVISSLDGEIELELISDQLKITTPKFDATVNTISATEFPTIPSSKEEPVLIEAKLLQNSLPEISFAAATDEGRPILTGILTEIKKDILELVATDGFRLAHKSIKLGTESTNFKALIPKRTLDEVVRLISEEGEVDKIGISISENQIVFQINQTIVSSRLIEGNYPAWEKVIPTEAKNRTVIDRGELLKAAKLSSVFAKDSANLIRIKTTEGKLILSSQTKELGQSQVEVTAQVEGEAIEIAFNSKFLLDTLNTCPSSQILVEFSGNLAPVLIKGVGLDGLEYVVTPVRES